MKKNRNQNQSTKQHQKTKKQTEKSDWFTSLNPTTNLFFNLTVVPCCWWAIFAFSWYLCNVTKLEYKTESSSAVTSCSQYLLKEWIQEKGKEFRFFYSILSRLFRKKKEKDNPLWTNSLVTFPCFFCFLDWSFCWFLIFSSFWMSSKKKKHTLSTERLEQV